MLLPVTSTALFTVLGMGAMNGREYTKCQGQMMQKQGIKLFSVVSRSEKLKNMFYKYAGQKGRRLCKNRSALLYSACE